MSSFFWLRSFVFLLLSFVFFSCSGVLFKMGYNYADTFVLRRIDSYFNLTAQQKATLRQQLKLHHDWHRQNELPKYIALLALTRSYAADGFSPAEIEEIWQKVEKRRDTLMQVLIPDAAQFLTTLSAAQISYFEKKVLAELAQLEEEEQELAEKKQKKREAKFIKSYEEWYGPTMRNQRENLAFLARQVPPFSDGLASYRRERLREFLEHLQEKQFDVEAHKKILTRYWVNPLLHLPPERKKQVAIFFAGLKKFIFHADSLATERQRQHLIKRLLQWEERLGSLLL